MSNSKMFNISPNQVKVLIVTSKVTEDAFLSFLFNLGTSWIERDYESLAKRFENYNILLIRDDDSRLERVFRALYEVPGIFYYYVGTKHLLTPDNVDIFNKFIYVNKEQWKDFNATYKNVHGLTFEQLLKEIK